MPPKPRKSGVIEIRGPYYAPTTIGYAGSSEMWGDYIDGFKFAGGSMRLLSVDMVKRILKVCHDHDVYVSTGGFVERIDSQGPDAVERYLEECKSLQGSDVVEISSGLAPIPLDDKVEITKQVKRMGMIAKPEISLMIGAGAGTHIVGYKPKLRDVGDLMKEARAHLKAGAQIMMLESEGITEDLPPTSGAQMWSRSLSQSLGLNLGCLNHLIPQFSNGTLKNFGSNVNLFIDHSQIVEYTAWRTKLWGDPEIWKGKRLSYKSKNN